MYQEQRLEKILELLEERKQLSPKEMVDYFKVSKDTIRRDFALLSQRQLVRRTHGGLLPLNKEPGPSYLDRSQKANKDCHGSKGSAIDPRWTSDFSRRFHLDDPACWHAE